MAQDDRNEEPEETTEEIQEGDRAAKLKQQQIDLERFLSADPNLEPDTQRLYIKSLDVHITVRELNDVEFSDFIELQEARSAKRSKGGQANQSLLRLYARIIAQALVVPDVRSPEFMGRYTEKYGIANGPDLVLKLFKPMEIIAIGDAIVELSGGAEDAVEVAKN